MKTQLLRVGVRKYIEMKKQLKRGWCVNTWSHFTVRDLMEQFRLLKLKPLPSQFWDCGWDLKDTGIKLIIETSKEGCEGG